MSPITQNNKIAISAVSIFLASFVSMLVFMNQQDVSSDYVKADVLETAKEHGLQEGGHGVYFSGEGHGDSHEEEAEAGHSVDAGDEDLYRAIAGNFDDPLFALKPTGHVEFLSQSFCEDYGYELNEMEKNVFFSYIYASDLPEFVATYTEVIQSGKSVDRVGPYRFLNSDGTKTVHLISLLPVVNEDTDKVTEVIGTLKDITHTLEDFAAEEVDEGTDGESEATH
jgi:PAS domain S-box-containing protein